MALLVVRVVVGCYPIYDEVDPTAESYDKAALFNWAKQS